MNSDMKRGWKKGDLGLVCVFDMRFIIFVTFVMICI